MLEFVNILEEKPFQERYGTPDVLFGIEKAYTERPLSFMYLEDSAVTSFTAVKVDQLGSIIKEVSLSTSLIVLYSYGGNTYHLCDGLTDYISDLDEGIYYFLVNEKHQSGYFLNEANIPTTVSDENISVWGLAFYDSEVDADWLDKVGAPDIYYGVEFGTNTKALGFRYLAQEVVTSFKAVKIDQFRNIIETIDLDLSILYDGYSHFFTGTVELSTFLNIGTYYLVVNDRYYSQTFCIATLTCFILSNIVVSEANEDKVLVFDFDGELSGIEEDLNLDLTFSFSCGIPSYTQSFFFYQDTRSYTANIAIPDGVSGNCTMTISSNLCEKTYITDFFITPAVVCELELENSTNLELENGTDLELENCDNEGIIEFVDDTDIELVGSGFLEFVN